MEKKTAVLEEFKQFAQERLNIHQRELDTRYENQAIDTATLRKAYSDHQEIYRQELQEKMEDLSAGEPGEWLRTELKTQQDQYISKLNFNQS